MLQGPYLIQRLYTRCNLGQWKNAQNLAVEYEILAKNFRHFEDQLQELTSRIRLQSGALPNAMLSSGAANATTTNVTATISPMVNANGILRVFAVSDMRKIIGDMKGAGFIPNAVYIDFTRQLNSMGIGGHLPF